MEEEKTELQEEITELEEDNRNWRKNQDYMNGLLEREQQAKIYQYHRVTELEKKIEVLKIDRCGRSYGRILSRRGDVVMDIVGGISGRSFWKRCFG